MGILLAKLRPQPLLLFRAGFLAINKLVLLWTLLVQAWVYPRFLGRFVAPIA